MVEDVEENFDSKGWDNCNSSNQRKESKKRNWKICKTINGLQFVHIVPYNNFSSIQTVGLPSELLEMLLTIGRF